MRTAAIPAALRQTLLYALGILVMKSVSLFMLPYLTGRLGTAEFGELEVLLSLAAVGSVLVGMGLTDALFRFVGDPENDRQRRELGARVFGLVLIVGLLALLLGQLAAPLVAELLPGRTNMNGTRMVLAMLALEGSITVPLAWLRIDERASLFFLVTAGKALLQASLVVALLQYGLGVSGVILAGLIAAGIQAAALIALQLRATGVAWDNTTNLRLTRYGLPIVVGGLAAFAISGLDRWLLAEAIGTAAMAQYAVAAKFALVVALLLQPFGMWWYPRRFVVVRAPNGHARAAKTASLGTALGIVVAVGVALTAPLVLQLLFPPQYLQAAVLVPWLATAVALKNAAELLNLGCYIGTTTNQQLLVNLAGSAVGVGGLLTLIPAWGAIGAAAALILAQFTRLSLFLYLSQRTLRLPYPGIRLAALALLAGLAMATGIGPLGVQAPVLAAIAGCLLVSVVAMTLGLVPLPGSRHFQPGGSAG